MTPATVDVEPSRPERELRFPEDFLRQLTAVGEVDILVFVPSLNNRATIGHVINALQLGLVKYFPRDRTAVLNADGGSQDGTQEAVRDAAISDFRGFLSANPLRTMHRITTTYDSNRGSAAAMELLLTAADLLRAKVCAVVSPDLESITPEWIESLVRPVRREEFDFVTPIFHRHKYEGLLIKNLVAPAFRAMYGVRVKEPVSGEFAFSRRLVSYVVEGGPGHGPCCNAGLGLGLLTAAAVNNFRICQSFLGPRIYRSHQQESDLVRLLQDTLGAVLQGIEMNEACWIERKESSAVPTFGFEYSVALQPVRISRKRLLEGFRLGVGQLGEILGLVLAPETWLGVQEIARLQDSAFRFPDELWARVVYDFAASYHLRTLNRDHLLQALLPLYRGRIFSFVANTERDTPEEVEARLEKLSLAFERLKPYLIERWKIEKGAQ